MDDKKTSLISVNSIPRSSERRLVENQRIESGVNTRSLLRGALFPVREHAPKRIIAHKAR